MAELLVKAGVRVAITGRNRSRADAIAEQLGLSATGVELDVRDEASVQSGVEEAYTRRRGRRPSQQRRRWHAHRQPAVHDKCAAVLGGLAGRLSRRDGTKAIGCFLLARALIPRMLEAGHGRLVTISMNESTMVRRGFTPYGPSGAAVEALARVMAADLAGTSVTANILLPGGATETGMVPDDTPDDVRARLLDPAIMGSAIVWLASPLGADTGSAWAPLPMVLSTAIVRAGQSGKVSRRGCSRTLVTRPRRQPRSRLIRRPRAAKPACNGDIQERHYQIDHQRHQNPTHYKRAQRQRHPRKLVAEEDKQRGDDAVSDKPRGHCRHDGSQSLSREN